MKSCVTWVEFHRSKWYGYCQPFQIRRSEIIKFEAEAGWSRIHTRDDCFTVAESYEEVARKLKPLDGEG